MRAIIVLELDLPDDHAGQAIADALKTIQLAKVPHVVGPGIRLVHDLAPGDGMATSVIAYIDGGASPPRCDCGLAEGIYPTKPHTLTQGAP